MVELSKIKSNFTVLYFYPKDNTPGCTIEAKGFNKTLKLFSKHKAEIIGISGGDQASKTKFCKKYKLKLTLLSDTNFKVSKKYDCFGKKTFMGRNYLGIFRKTFLLDKSKKVIATFDKVSPDTHARELLELLASMKLKPRSMKTRNSK